MTNAVMKFAKVEKRLFLPKVTPRLIKMRWLV